MNSDFWDTRALAGFRVCIGLYLMWYSALCLYWGDTFFTDFGVLPLSFLTQMTTKNGFGSLYLASRWWAWAHTLLFIQLLLSVCVTIGFRVNLLAAPLAYLLWSLNARNPFVSGLAEDWLVLLILTLGLLPVTREFSVEDCPAWGETRTALEGPRAGLALIFFLATPGAWICEQLFTETTASWTWLGFAAFAGLLLPARLAAARNLAVILFMTWTIAAWFGQGLALVGILVGLAFSHLRPPKSTSPYSMVFIPAILAALLQAYWVSHQLGFIDRAPPEAIQRHRSLSGDFYRQFEFSPDAGGQQSLNLYDELDVRSALMRRYLNSLYRVPREQQLVHLMSYFARTTDGLKVGETRTYTVLARSLDGKPADRLFRIVTIPHSQAIWEAMPALDRNPLQ
jgi:hypothetical protein